IAGRTLRVRASQSPQLRAARGDRPRLDVHTACRLLGPRVRIHAGVRRGVLLCRQEGRRGWWLGVAQLGLGRRTGQGGGDALRPLGDPGAEGSEPRVAAHRRQRRAPVYPDDVDEVAVDSMSDGSDSALAVPDEAHYFREQLVEEWLTTRTL